MANGSSEKTVIEKKLAEIEASDDSAKALRDTFKTKDEWFDVGSPKDFIRKHYPMLSFLGVDDIVSGMLSKLISSNDAEDVFYERLWRFLSNDALFESRLEREGALFFSLLDNRLPYFRVKAVQMDEEEFKTRVNNLKEPVAKLVCLSNRKFQQKTEQGSAALDLVLQEEDAENRALLLGLYLSFISKAVEG